MFRRADQLRTSSFLLDDDILIDAGTGVEDLTVPELARIDHVFLSHSHLDHICALPLMIDSVGGSRKKPLIVHALQETIDALKAHIFNWVIWPDFTEIPHYERPWMVFEPLTVGTAVTLGNRRIRPIAANHTVPAIGFHLSSPGRLDRLLRRHLAQRRVLAHDQRHPRPEVPHHRERLLQQGAGPGDHRQAPVSHPAQPGAGQPAGRAADPDHAPQALGQGADRAGDQCVGGTVRADDICETGQTLEI